MEQFLLWLFGVVARGLIDKMTAEELHAQLDAATRDKVNASVDEEEKRKFGNMN